MRDFKYDRFFTEINSNGLRFVIEALEVFLSEIKYEAVYNWVTGAQGVGLGSSH